MGRGGPTTAAPPTRPDLGGPLKMPGEAVAATWMPEIGDRSDEPARARAPVQHEARLGLAHGEVRARLRLGGERLDAVLHALQRRDIHEVLVRRDVREVLRRVIGRDGGIDRGLFA